MKKIYRGFILGILFIPLLVLNVHATASDFNWHTEKVEDEPLEVKWVNGTFTLYLKDYNGSGLCMWGHTNRDRNYIIVLEGENKITSDSVGIETYGKDVKLYFVGNGTLTINAPKPLSYADYTDTLTINPSKNEMTVVTKQIVEQTEEQKTEEVTTQEEPTKEITTETEDNKKDTATTIEFTIDYELFFIISTIVAALLLGVTIILMIKLKKKK